MEVGGTETIIVDVCTDEDNDSGVQPVFLPINSYIQFTVVMFRVHCFLGTDRSLTCASFAVRHFYVFCG